MDNLPEKFYTTTNDLRKELEGKIKDLDDKINKKSSKDTINILITIVILAFAGAFSCIGYIFIHTNSINDRLIQLETKIDDMHLKK